MESHRRTERCQNGSALSEETTEELKYFALLQSTPLAGFDDPSLNITAGRLFRGAGLLGPCHCDTLWGQMDVEMSFALLYVRAEQRFIFEESEVYNGSEVSQYLADMGICMTSSGQEIGPQHTLR
jgi:hypothetical protein